MFDASLHITPHKPSSRFFYFPPSQQAARTSVVLKCQFFPCLKITVQYALEPLRSITDISFDITGMIFDGVNDFNIYSKVYLFITLGNLT